MTPNNDPIDKFKIIRIFWKKLSICNYLFKNIIILNHINFNFKIQNLVSSHLSNIRESIKSGKYIFLSNLTEKAAFFLAYILIARNYSSSMFGLITYTFVLSNIINSFVELGFPLYFQREITFEKSNFNEELNNVLLFRIYLFVPYFILIFIFSYNELLNNFLLIAFISLSSFILGINNLLNKLLFGKENYKKSFQIILSSRIILLVLVLLLILLRKNIQVVALAFLVSSVVQLILCYKVLRYLIQFKNCKINYFIILNILKSSLPIGISLIFVWFYDRIDVVLLKNLLNARMVAIYAAAYSVYKLSQLLSRVVLVPAFTNFSKNFLKFNSIKFKDINSYATFLIILSALFMIVMFIYADKITAMLYGKQYLDSAKFLKYLLIAVPGLFLNDLTGTLLNSTRQEKYILLTTGIGVTLNIICNIILINTIGIMGAVISTIITEYFLLFSQLLILKNKKEIFYV